MQDNFRRNHHTYRNKEDGTEEVFDRAYQMFNVLTFHCLCQYAAHYEGAKCG